MNNNSTKCARCGELFVSNISKENYDGDERFLEFCPNCDALLPRNLFFYDNKPLKESFQNIVNNTTYEDKIVKCDVCNKSYIVTKEAQEFDAKYGILSRPDLCEDCIKSLDLLKHSARIKFLMTRDNFMYTEPVIEYMKSNCEKEKMVKWCKINVKAFILEQLIKAHEQPVGLVEEHQAAFWEKYIEDWDAGEEICSKCFKLYTEASPIRRMEIHSLGNPLNRSGVRRDVCPDCDEENVELAGSTPDEEKVCSVCGKTFMCKGTTIYYMSKYFGRFDFPKYYCPDCAKKDKTCLLGVKNG